MSALKNFLAARPSLAAGTIVALQGAAAAHYGSGLVLVARIRDAGDEIDLDVLPLEKDATGNLRAAARRTISLRKTDALAHTGHVYTAATVRTAADVVPGANQLLKSIFTKAKQPALFAGVDWNKEINVASAVLFRKYAWIKGDMDEQHDLALTAMIDAFSPTTIAKFDPTKAKPAAFFVQTAYVRRLNQLLLSGARRNNKTQDAPAGFDPSDGVDPIEALEQNSHLHKLGAYLLAKPDGKKYLAPILGMVLIGASNQDIADKLEVSKGQASKKVSATFEAIKEFAEKMGDHALAKAIADAAGKRRQVPQMASIAHEAAEDMNTVLNILRDVLKKVASGHTADAAPAPRKPVGDITRVQVKEVPDVLCGETLGRLLLSDQVTQKSMDDTASQFLTWLEEQDDLVDSDNGIVGLRVQHDEVRPTQPAKAARRK